MKRTRPSQVDIILTDPVHRLQSVHNPRDDMPSLPGGVPHSDGSVHLIRALQRAHVAPDVPQDARGRRVRTRSRYAERLGAVLCRLRLYHRHLGRHVYHAVVDRQHVRADQGEEGRGNRAGEHVCCFDVDLDSGTSLLFSPQPSAFLIQNVAHLHITVSTSGLNRQLRGMHCP